MPEPTDTLGPTGTHAADAPPDAPDNAALLDAVAMFVTDAAGTPTFVSRRLLEMVGAEPGTTPGRWWDQSVHPDDVADLSEITNASAGADGARRVVRLRRAGAEPLSVRVEVSPVLDDSGRVARRVVIVSALDEHARAQRFGESGFRTVFDNAPDAIFIKDTDKRYLHVNDALAGLFGLEPEHMIGKTEFEILGEPSETFVRSIDDRVLAGETVEFDSVRKIRGVEEAFHVIKVPTYDASGRVTGICGIARCVTERHRVERALRRSEERFRAIFNMAGDAILIIDPENGVIIDHNADAAELFARRGAGLVGVPVANLRRDEPVGGPAWGPLGPERAPRLALWACVAATGREFWAEVQLCCAEISGRARILAVARDVTSRKATEDALIAARNRLDQLVSAGPAVIFSCEGDGRNNATYVSRNVKQLTGFEPDDFRRDPRFWQRRVHPEDRANAVEQWVRGVEAGAMNHEYRFRRRDGTYRWTRCSFIVNDAAVDPPADIVGTWQDITGSKAAESAWRESEQRYRALVETAPEAIVVLDVDRGAFVDFNENATRLFKTTSEQLARFGPIELSPDLQADGRPSHEAADELVQRALDGEILDFRWLHRDAEGAVFPAEVRASRLPSSEARLVRASIVDITDQIREERARDQRDEHLRRSQKLEAIGRLAGGVAHDFNNLVMAIRGHVGLAQSALEENHPARAALAHVDEAARQAADVTLSLLTFTRGNTTRKTPTDLPRIVTDACRLHRAALPAAVAVETTLPDESDAWINADPAQMHQVLMNLILNARDAMPDGGVLAIDVTTTGSPGAGWVQLAVRDDGIGMTSDVREELFEPYFTTKPRGQGTGLGLSIIHGIVKDHAGTINVESRLGGGSTFTLRFPRTKPGRRVGSVGAGSFDPPRYSGRVLLAEDNPHVRGVLATMLSMQGFRLLVASDGPGAVELLDDLDPPDLFVLDVDLPGCSGLECLRRARARGMEAPALLITGGTPPDLPDNLRARVRILPKPFMMRELRSEVEDLLGTGEPSPGA